MKIFVLSFLWLLVSCLKGEDEISKEIEEVLFQLVFVSASGEERLIERVEIEKIDVLPEPRGTYGVHVKLKNQLVSFLDEHKESVKFVIFFGSEKEKREIIVDSETPIDAGLLVRGLKSEFAEIAFAESKLLLMNEKEEGSRKKNLTPPKEK